MLAQNLVTFHQVQLLYEYTLEFIPNFEGWLRYRNIQGDSKNSLTQNEIIIENTSDKNIEIKYLYVNVRMAMIDLSRTV